MISLMLSARFMKTGISWFSKNDRGIESEGFITGSIYNRACVFYYFGRANSAAASRIIGSAAPVTGHLGHS